MPSKLHWLTEASRRSPRDNVAHSEQRRAPPRNAAAAVLPEGFTPRSLYSITCVRGDAKITEDFPALGDGFLANVTKQDLLNGRRVVCIVAARHSLSSSAPSSRTNFSQISRADPEWGVQQRRRHAKAVHYYKQKSLRDAADASQCHSVALPPAAECNTFQLCMAKYLADCNAIIVRRAHVTRRLRIEEMMEQKEHLKRETLAAFLYSEKKKGKNK